MSVHPSRRQRILLTGATGFTGQHLRRIAADKGYDVVSLRCDICCFNSVLQQVQDADFDYVVHLAGVSASQCSDEQKLFQINVKGTENVLRAVTACKARVRKILLASSVLVYGSSPASPVTESSPLVAMNPYAQSKIDMERVALRFARDLPICIVRAFNYTGVGQSEQFLVPKIVNHFKRCDAAIEIGNTNVHREFNDVRFVCDAYLCLLHESNTHDVVNVCCGRPHGINDVIGTLVGLTGHKMDVRVRQDLVRSNDISVLYGDPARLNSVAAQSGAKWSNSMMDLLCWMLRN
jgi:GDP-6-deoxy-D-talose 4-dehydrogenase